jgi:hypothetical protein
MDLRFRTWQVPYLDAVSEIPQGNLRERIDIAERAILIRLEVLSRTPGREAERLAIGEALTALNAIKKDKLAFPHWEQSQFRYANK